ncbi:MAG: multiheme c-type cytochrome [Acidobacteriota bacterium]
MKKSLTWAALAIPVSFAAGAYLAHPVPPQEYVYVGAQKCQICHRTERQGRQFPIWDESRHSKSFAALTGPAAASKAKDAGLATPGAENESCLKCHAPLYAKAPEIKTEGVTCEVCHGPGSVYKKLSLMSNRTEAAQRGLLVYENTDKIKALCLTCHADAHGKAFDFDAAWPKIKHVKP